MIGVSRNHEEKALVGLMGFAGCRVTEARSIRPDNIDVESLRLTIVGKGDKTRIVPLSDEAFNIIADAYVYAKLNDTALITYGDRFARECVKNMGKRAGVAREVASHDLRMTFGTMIFNKTMNIRVAQELLGHESSGTTEVYTGVAMEQMIEAVNF